MSFLGFLIKKKFYIHLGISIVLSVGLLLITIGLLQVYTRHGDAYLVPDLNGKPYSSLQENEDARIFNLIVTDSVYDNSLLPGSVIKQNPGAGSKAKEGRTIYLTVVSLKPKMSMMPELKDLTIRQAVTTLRSNGLKIRTLRYIPHFAENSVLGHYFEGDTLLAGTEILEGSEIDIVAGLGTNHPARVPFVVGLTRDNARGTLQMASLNSGREFYLDQPDPIHSKVYLQYPEWDEQLMPGDSVSLYFRSDLSFNFDSLILLINPDTAVIMVTPEGMLLDSLDFEEE